MPCKEAAMFLIWPGKAPLALLLLIPIIFSTGAFAGNSNGNGIGNTGGAGNVRGNGNDNAGGNGKGNAGGGKNSNGNNGASSQSQENGDTNGGDAPVTLPPNESFANAPPDSPVGKLKTYYTAEVAAFAADAALKKAELAVSAANKDLLTAQAMAKRSPSDPVLAQATIASKTTLNQATAALNAARSNAVLAHTTADTKLAAAVSKHFSPNARAWLDTKLAVMFHTK